MADYIYEKKPFPNRSFENKMIKIYLCHKLVFLWLCAGFETLDSTTHQAPIQKNAFVSVTQ